MLRLTHIIPLMIGAITLIAVPFTDAGAQEKDRGKSKMKLCPGKQVPVGDRCVGVKSVPPPAALQIGGSSFGASGSAFKGGVPGTTLMPSPKPSPHGGLATGGATTRLSK